jgi:uncharacterized membrane protein YjfL (UPF0719 family)
MHEWDIVRANAISFATNLVLGIVALFVGALAIMAIDRIVLRKLDLEAEIARGNLAAAVLAGAIWIALALILTHSG